MKRLTLLLLVAGMAVTAQDKLKTSVSEKPVDSAWRADATCGGLHATMWSDGKGWHEADCMEIATKLSELRDVSNVMVSTGPDIPSMLAYSQYESEFRITQSDFAEAQKICRKLLNEGSAVPSILSQCKKTVAGIVPYGLKLKYGGN